MNLYERYQMAYRKILPDQAYLQACFRYDSGTGLLVWRERPASHFTDPRIWKSWNGTYAGKTAGRVQIRKSDGYAKGIVGIGDTEYKTARVIYKLMTDEEPEEVDHQDKNPQNMAWHNLRASTRGTNCLNRGKQKNNQSGFKGVIERKDLTFKRFQARIRLNGKVTYLGYFTTAEEA